MDFLRFDRIQKMAFYSYILRNACEIQYQNISWEQRGDLLNWKSFCDVLLRYWHSIVSFAFLNADTTAYYSPLEDGPLITWRAS
jgi:hypothetical protein